MNYHGKGMYQWDTWYCKEKDSDRYHAFYLQKCIPGGGRQEKEGESLGHAVSTNLIDWQELPPVLPPEKRGKRGDLQSWTGSTIEHDGKYYMFYTIRSSESNTKVQEIGLAESDDLMCWRKSEKNPVITPDPRWYNTEENPAENGLVDCRDLMVVKHPEQAGYFGVFATRVNTPTLQEGAVFAGAYTENFLDWEQTPPVFSSAENKYTIVEMPDLFYFEGKWYLTWLEDNQYGNREILDDFFLTCGTVYAVSDKVEGPYLEPEDNTLMASMGYNGFSCRSVDFHGKKYMLHSMGTRIQENEQKAEFGALAIPKELRIVDGNLRMCYADLVEEKICCTLISPETAAQVHDVRMFYENAGIWNHETGLTIGKVKYGWSRFGLWNQADNFIFTASICIKEGIAAGLSLYCESGCVTTQSLAVMLDVERQKVFCASVPRFQISDMRPWKLEWGKLYSLKIVAVGKFLEVYLDEILVLQLVNYFQPGKHLALMIDRCEAEFRNIGAWELSVPNSPKE